MSEAPSARSQQWEMQCLDEDGDPVSVRVVQIGASVALIAPDFKPLWMDRFSGDHLASLLLRAVSASTYAPPSSGRHESDTERLGGGPTSSWSAG
jgi:hypothetical protein